LFRIQAVKPIGGNPVKVYTFEEYPKKIMVLGRRVTVNSKAEEGLLHSAKNKTSSAKKVEVVIPEIVPEIAEIIELPPAIESPLTVP